MDPMVKQPIVVSSNTLRRGFSLRAEGAGGGAEGEGAGQGQALSGWRLRGRRLPHRRPPGGHLHLPHRLHQGEKRAQQGVHRGGGRGSVGLILPAATSTYLTGSTKV
eukprot:1193336-Prorocentrum_minimum.AAC.3